MKQKTRASSEDEVVLEEEEALGRVGKPEYELLDEAMAKLIELGFSGEIHEYIAEQIADWLGQRGGVWFSWTNTAVGLCQQDQLAGDEQFRQVVEEGGRDLELIFRDDHSADSESWWGSCSLKVVDREARRSEMSRERFRALEELMDLTSLEQAYTAEFTYFGASIGKCLVLSATSMSERRWKTISLFMERATYAVRSWNLRQIQLQHEEQLIVVNAISSRSSRALGSGNHVAAILEELSLTTNIQAGLWSTELEYDENGKEKKKLTNLGRVCEQTRCPNQPSSIPIEWSNDVSKRPLGYSVSECFEQGSDLEIESCCNCIFIPLGPAGYCFGYLCVFRLSECRPTFRQPEFLRALGHRFGLALRNGQLQQAANEHRLQLSSLSSELMKVEDVHQRKIASDVHDRIGQPLSLARMLLTAQVMQISNEEERARFDGVIELLARAIRETRAITGKLHNPVLESFGLGAALEAAVDSFEASTGISTVTDIRYREMQESLELRTYLLRVLEELLLNSAKHAAPTEVSIELGVKDGWLHLNVKDNGKGCDVNALWKRTPGQGIGLLSVRERIAAVGGSFHIESGLGQGTSAFVSVPIGVSETSFL